MEWHNKAPYILINGMVLKFWFL